MSSPSENRVRSLFEDLCLEVAEIVGNLPPSIGFATRFGDVGLDSAGATALASRLSNRLARRLPVTLIWEHPTFGALARYLGGEGNSGVEPHAGRLPGAVETADEPIAVVGMSCRFPGGVDSPEAFWELLRTATCAVTEVPAARWNSDDFYDEDYLAPGRTHTRGAGFLEHVDQFDPTFFEISPREAVQMDPQQRLALELAWEALEDAGIPADTLVGTPTGVFLGVSWNDYLVHQHQLGEQEIAPHTVTGSHYSIVANRISYVFGFQGPSMAIDAACASSLLATHLACESLRRGESRVALAGGVNLILSPYSTVSVSKFGALSADGLCKTFDARADGYGRGEGGGLVVLKRLSQALEDGDSICCLIRGSAANNDGFSQSLTAPNPAAQEAVIRTAWAAAAVPVENAQYVEVHGTGTPLGDPIEAKALAAALTADRAMDRPLRVGSVKTNIGHLEAAAGIAGLIKVALAIRHGQLPPSLHFERPNPHIPFADFHLEVQKALAPWPDADRSLLAGVSSFGFGGTNCHAVLEGLARRRTQIFVLSASDAPALRQAAGELVRSLPRSADEPAGRLVDLCRSAAAASAGRRRLALPVRTVEELAGRLAEVVEEPGLPAPAPRRPVVFLFPGHGSQWVGMGRDLFLQERVFARTVRDCDRVVRRIVDWSPLRELFADDDRSRMNRCAVALPMVVVTQIALAAQLRAWGLRPDYVIGQSIGEIAAAWMAGILSLEDALHVICNHGRVLTQLEGSCGMAVVGLGGEAVTELLGSRTDPVVAGWIGPSTTVLSGDSEALQEVLAEVQGRGIFAATVQTTVPGHSPYMSALYDQLEESARGIRPQPARIPMLSTMTVAPLSGPECGSDYWAHNLGSPVRLSEAVARLAESGEQIFVEVGPHPVLARPVAETLADFGSSVPVLATLKRHQDGRACLAETLTAADHLGAEVDWSGLYPPGDTPAGSLLATTSGDPAVGERGAADRPSTAEPNLLVLSARSAEALRARAEALATHLRGGPEASLAEVCHTAATGRCHFDHRLAVVAGSRPELVEVLGAFVSDTPHPDWHRGRRSTVAPKVVFVFPGQGSQWPAMGRRLLAEEPVFRAAVAACDEAVGRWTGWSVAELLGREDEDERWSDDAVIQPLLFTMAVSLAALWRSWGVEPSAVVGYSQGEIAAAQVSGALSLADAARVVCERSRLIREGSGPGLMAVVQLPEAAVRERLVGFEDRLSVAVVNSAHSTVVSGDHDAVEELRAEWESSGVFCRLVKVAYASHSPHMEPLLAAIGESLAGLSPGPTSVPMMSTVTGDWVSGEELGAEYWCRNLRTTVRFGAAMEGLLASGHGLYVEQSAHPLQVQAVLENLEEAPGLAVGSLRRESGGRGELLRSLAALYGHGVDPSWEAVLAGGGPPVRLPTYPFQRRRHWLKGGAPRSSQLAQACDHPLLGSWTRIAGRGALFEAELSAEKLPYLAGCRILGRVAVPAAAMLEMALAAADAYFGPGLHAARDVVLAAPMVLGENGARRVQLVLEDRAESAAAFELYGQPVSARPDDAWRLHAGGRLLRDGAPEEAGVIDSAQLGRNDGDLREPQDLYAALAASGLDYDPVARSLAELRKGEGEAAARVVVPEGEEPESAESYGVHPVLLDGAIHALLDVAPTSDGGNPLLPCEVGSYAVYRSGASELRVRAALTPCAQGEETSGPAGTIALLDAAGQAVASIRGLRFQRIDEGGLRESGSALRRDWLYRLAWRALEPPPVAARSGRDGAWLLIGEDRKTAALAALLQATGAEVHGCGVDQDLAQAWSGIGGAIAGVVTFWGGVGSGEPGVAAAGTARTAERTAIRALEQLQRLLEAASLSAAPPPLWWVTEGAQAVSPGEGPDPSSSVVWGLGRSWRQEQPDWPLVLVDLEPGAGGEGAAALLGLIAGPPGELETAVRGGLLLAARLVRADVGDPQRAAVRPGTVLVTGGLGGLGLLVARWLVTEHGVRHLLLLGRSAPSGERLAALDELRALGAEVTTAQCDVADRARLAEVLGAVPESWPLRGVMHLAMVLDDGVLAEQNAERFSGVLAPKVAGTWNLHRLTAEHDLDFFVLFSSLASLLGTAGQSNYAAANAFLDALAAQRRSRGLPGQSLNWGPWAELGAAARLDATLHGRLVRQGLDFIEPQQGLALLDEVLGRPEAQLGVLPLDLRRLARSLGDGPVPSVLQELVRRRAAAAAKDGGLEERLRPMPADRRQAAVLDLVRAEIARILAFESSSAVPPDAPLRDLGLDSLTAVELRNGLSVVVGRRLSATLAFDYPSAGEMAGFLLRTLLPEAAAPPAVAPPPAGDGARAIGEMSDDEMDLFLRDQLAELEDLLT